MSVSLDEIAPNYRAAVERWPDAPTLASHYQAVFESFNGSGHGLIETVKSFIECVCLTILGDFGEAMPSATPSTSGGFNTDDLLGTALSAAGHIAQIGLQSVSNSARSLLDKLPRP